MGLRSAALKAVVTLSEVIFLLCKVLRKGSHVIQGKDGQQQGMGSCSGRAPLAVDCCSSAAGEPTILCHVGSSTRPSFPALPLLRHLAITATIFPRFSLFLPSTLQH